jgi:Protein of unknown function (DUF3499)
MARTLAAGSVAGVRSRRCSRAVCSRPAVATLTYVYLESTAVLGPLVTRAEPHGYDLCQDHAESLSAPRGWEVIRLAVESDPAPSTDDLLALADAVREVGFSYDQTTAGESAVAERASGIVELGRRGHLTVLADPEA